MKAHKTVMIALVVMAALLLIIGPALNVGIGLSLLLLLCPQMMFVMMAMMGHDKNDGKQC